MVTGGANGLGKEIAIKLAEQGCHVAVVDIDLPAAESTAKYLTETYNVKAKAFKTDVSKLSEVEALSKNVEKELGPVTILVNNAGIMMFSTSEDTPPSEIQNMIDTNFTSNVWTVRVFLDKMRELGKGHIVGIGSLSGVITCPRQIVYSATKYGLRGFMNSLSSELFTLNCEFIKTTHVVAFFLDTNMRVINKTKQSGFLLYPITPGVEAAEIIVDGILTNKMQVFIPGLIGPLYRMIELLPKDWQAKIVNASVSRDVLKKMVHQEASDF